MVSGEPLCDAVVARQRILCSWRGGQVGVFDAWAPELMCLLRLGSIGGALWTFDGTYGGLVQNLILRIPSDANGRTAALTVRPYHTPLRRGSAAGNTAAAAQTRHRIGLLLTDVVLVYAWTRANTFVIEDGWASEPPGSWRHRVYRALRWLERILIVAQVLNRLLFLKGHRCAPWVFLMTSGATLLARSFPTLSHRLLGVVWSERDQRSAGVAGGYEFMGHQLIWDGLADFALFTAPFLRSSIVSRLAAGPAALLARIMAAGRVVPSPSNVASPQTVPPPAVPALLCRPQQHDARRAL